MSLLQLSPIETPIVHRALVAISEANDMEATTRVRLRGHDRHVDEQREEAELLRAVAKRLTADQSPRVSRASARGAAEEWLAGLDDEGIRSWITAGEALLDARFLAAERAVSREVRDGAA